MNYKYNLNDELWYIDIEDYKIKRGRIQQKYYFFKEDASPPTARQIVVYILKLNSNPSTRFINYIVCKCLYNNYSYDQPNNSEGYVFFPMTANIPLEFISETEEGISVIRNLMFKIFNIIKTYGNISDTGGLIYQHKQYDVMVIDKYFR